LRGTGRVRVWDELRVESRAQHRKLCEGISHRDRDVLRVSRKIPRFRDCRGVGSRARRLGELVADDQLRSTRSLATQSDACSGRRPTPAGDGTTTGERPTAVEEGGDGEGLSQSSVRVLSAGRELLRKLLFCFPKTQFRLSIKGSSSYTW